MGHFVHYCMTGILVLFYSLAGLIPSCQAATNLALGKSYMVSPAPNYPHSAPPSDHTSLTDGIYTKGYFWTQKTTVGWDNNKTVEILIDLEKVSAIKGISFNTARYAGVGVYYAQNIFVYVGPDKEHLSYVGDIAASPNNKPGEYQVQRFTLENMEVQGRFVLLEIITSPRCLRLFVDEIEVYEGDKASGIVSNLSIAEVRALLQQTMQTNIERSILKSISEKMIPELLSRFDLSGQFEQIQEKNRSLPNPGAAKAIETELRELRAKMLASQYPEQQIMLETIDPWSKLNPAQPISGKPLQPLSLRMPVGGGGYAAFLVTNVLSESRQVSIEQSSISGDHPIISVFQVPFIKSSALEYVADPLMPIQAAFTLQSGETRMIFLAAEGKTPGNWQSTLNVISDGVSIPVETNSEVLNVSLPQQFSLNSVNWGYLTYSLIKGREKLAVKDLFYHHTNVVVVPPVYLRGANQYERNNTLYRQAGPGDFLELEWYLKLHQGATKIILFLNFSGENHTTFAGKFPFMSEAWCVEFKKWYAQLVLAATRSGFSEEQLYLFPYDEMAGKQIDDFVLFAAWVKKAIPQSKLYATINNESPAKVLPYLDVAQVSNIEELLNKFSSAKCELWIYDTKYPTKSLSPYSYYRLMPWKAFLRGYKGVGFWAYADTGTEGTVWNDFDDNGRPDFAVIYDGKGYSIISSRRWEAWRMGLEDYEILKMYADKMGISAAKVMATSVLDHPEDTSKADQMRQTMLTKLSSEFIQQLNLKIIHSDR